MNASWLPKHILVHLFVRSYSLQTQIESFNGPTILRAARQNPTSREGGGWREGVWVLVSPESGAGRDDSYLHKHKSSIKL